MSLCLNAVSWASEPGEASARVERAASTKLVQFNNSWFPLCSDWVGTYFCPAPRIWGSWEWNLQPVRLCRKEVLALSEVPEKISWMQGKAVDRAELEKLSSTFWKNAWGISAEYSEWSLSHLGASRNTDVGNKTSLNGLAAAVPVFSQGNKSHSWGMFKKARLAQFGFWWEHGIVICGFFHFLMVQMERDLFGWNHANA